MAVLFTALFISFAKLSSEMDAQGAMSANSATVSIESQKSINDTIASSENVVAFTENETPKLFASVSSLPGSFQVESGTSELTGQSVVIGSSEAKMMKEEGLFKNVGDVLPDLFGAKNVTVRGILKPTGTLADSYHFLSPNAFKDIENAARLQVVDETNGTTKMFYFIEGLVPEKLKDDIKSTAPATIGDTTYYPVYVGYAEAKMMRENKLFANDGDTIKDFFGNNVIVYTLPETKTELDNMHFVDSSFVVTE